MPKELDRPFRYAVYHVPAPGSDFYKTGSALLGWSLRGGEPLERPVLPVVKSIEEFTRKASVYGFHSTVIAPFRTELGPETVRSAVRQALEGRKPFPLKKQELSLLNGFPALTVKNPMEPFMALEKSLLEGLSGLFLPPDLKSLQARGKLSRHQTELFWKWGYPFVLSEHRFHFTLGDPGASDAYINALKDLFPVETLENLVFDQVTLCVQTSPGARFIALEDFPLAG